MGLGEDGTEQFTVTTRVDGEIIGHKEIHDPFVSTTVKMRGWKHAWNALFHGITVNVHVNGTHGAMSAVMQLDPVALQKDTNEHLQEIAKNRVSMTTLAPQTIAGRPVSSYSNDDYTLGMMADMAYSQPVIIIEKVVVPEVVIEESSVPDASGFSDDSFSGGGFDGGGAGGDF